MEWGTRLPGQTRSHKRESGSFVSCDLLRQASEPGGGRAKIRIVSIAAATVVQTTRARARVEHTARALAASRRRSRRRWRTSIPRPTPAGQQGRRANDRPGRRARDRRTPPFLRANRSAARGGGARRPATPSPWPRSTSAREAPGSRRRPWASTSPIAGLHRDGTPAPPGRATDARPALRPSAPRSRSRPRSNGSWAGRRGDDRPVSLVAESGGPPGARAQGGRHRRGLARGGRVRLPGGRVLAPRPLASGFPAPPKIRKAEAPATSAEEATLESDLLPSAPVFREDTHDTHDTLGTTETRFAGGDGSDPAWTLRRGGGAAETVRRTPKRFSASGRFSARPSGASNRGGRGGRGHPRRVALGPRISKRGRPRSGCGKELGTFAKHVAGGGPREARRRDAAGERRG